MSESHHRSRIASLAGTVVLLLAACAGPSPTPSTAASTPSGAAPTSTTASTSRPTSPGPDAASQTPSTEQTAAPTGFAFAADDIVAYYESVGYTCSERTPSTKATGFFVRTCSVVDDAGRTRVIGIVTDPVGDLANAFASVQGKDTGAFLPPIDALDPLAAFLGATLGEEGGSALLPWLAGHLGDAYAATTKGALKVATYTASEADTSKLFVEIANQAYLDAPSAALP